MKHNNFFKTISAFLLLGLIVLASSCSHNIFDKASDVTQIKPVLGGSERTVFPDFDLDELYGIKLEAKKNGYTGGWVQLAIWDNTDALSAIDIEPGTYSFQLTAYQGEVEFIATTSGVKIEKGKVNSVNFALVVNTWGDPDTDRGNIRINVSWAADINAISNSVTLSRVDTDGTENSWYTESNVKVYYDNESKDGGWFINYSKYDLPVGEYKIDVVVTDENYKRGFYSDYIIVAAECTSANSFVIKDWTDIYAIASVLYSNESKHVKAEPDPNGKGVKFTLTYEEGDPDYWFDIAIEEQKSGIIWYYKIWDCDQNENLILGKDGLKKLEVVYPFVEDKENCIFKVNFGGGKIVPHENDTGRDFSYDLWIDETVVTTANGGDTSILRDDYLSRLQKCGVTTTDIGASFKLKYDITEIFARNVDWDEFRFNYNVYSGSKSEENVEVYSNWDCNLLNTYGQEEYEYFKPGADGFYITNQNALNELQKRSSYFAYADFNFRTKDNNLAKAKGYKPDNTTEDLNGHYRIGWTSEETPYAITKMNKITVVKDLNAKNPAGEYTDTEEFFYPANTKVTLKNPVRSGGWYCEGLYENADFTGNPVSTLSRDENTTDRVLYAKWGLVLSKDNDVNGMQMKILELMPEFNVSLKQGQFIAVTLTGHAESDFSGPIRFQIWNDSLWGKNNNDNLPGFRGVTVINQTIKAGQDFTMCFGVKVEHPWQEDYNVPNTEYTADIKPEDLLIQIMYDRSDYEPEFIISNPQITFDTDPLIYKYVLSGASDDVNYGAFVKDEKKTLPTSMNRWNWELADWYDNPDCTGSPIKEVAANDNNPKTFYAKWDMKFEHDEYNHNHHAYFNIKDYQNAFDTQIELPKVPENAQDSKMIVYVAELTGTPNIDFHGSMSANIHIPSRHRNNGDEVCICSPSDVFQGDSGHWTINDLAAGQEVTIRMPLRDWVNQGEGGYTVEPEDMNFYIEYWDSDCNENLILSDWKLEIKPAIEIYYKLDEDDQFRKDGAFVADNMEARRYGYYTEDDADSNGAITLLTSVERPGFSRKLDGWGRYTWNETLNNGEGNWEWHDVPDWNWNYADGSVELRPKWSLVFTEGHYENYETHNTSYNYGTDLTLNSIDYWKDRENVADEWGNVWNCGNKPNLKYGDHISITLEGEPTANIPPSQYGIIAQLYDKKWNEENSSWISMDAYCENILEEGNRARLVFDFDVPWTSEHNYEDLAIRFVYDTGTQKIHNNGIGLILSDYNIWYDILSEKVSVTYDYGYKKETTQVYKDGWYELPTDFGDMHEYFEREFEGWYITDTANYQGCVEERDFDKRVGWDCLKADGTTYKAKWNYKMMEGGYKDNGWDDEQGVHHTSETDRQWFFTYDTRISSDEFAEHPSGNIDKDKWYVLVVEGYSNANLNGIELSIDGWDKEGDVDYDTNYTVLRDESALFNLHANQNFKFVTKIKPYKTVMSYDYDAKLWKNSLTYCDEPTLSNVKIRLFEFDDEDAADIKITEIDAEQ